MQSEFFGYTFRVFLGNVIARLVLPVLLLKYKEFWGLRQATLKWRGGGGGGGKRGEMLLWVCSTIWG